MPDIFGPLFVFLCAYIIGSFPTAYVAGKLNGQNIFEMGSGNMGANNVLRSLGFKWGAAVFALDVLKGMLAVALARRIMVADEISASVISGIAVVIGHNWSLLATLLTGQLRGGKGAATAGGTWIMMAPPQVFVLTIGLWALLVLVTRYVSLAVLVSIGIGTIWMVILVTQPGGNVPPAYAIYAIAIAVMVYFRHRSNIQRLLAGQERRIGERA